MSGIRVLVTGGSGFVGGEVVKALTSQHPEFDLSVLDILPLAPEYLQEADIRFFHADITDPAAVEKAIQAARPHLIVHTAGVVPTRKARYSPTLQKELTYNINVDGTKYVLEAAKKYGVRRFVYTSSVTVITDDTNHDYPNVTEEMPLGRAKLVYGASKALGEHIVLAANDPKSDFLTCALRPSTLFGIGDKQLVPTIYDCIAKSETPFIIGSGSNLYDFSFVSNIADAHVLAVENLLSSSPTAAGEAFFISNGEPVPFRAFCLAVWANFGHYPPFEMTIPKSLAWFAGLMAEGATWAMGGNSTLSRGSVKDACQCGYASIEKARNILGYEPRVGLADGLRIACEDYKRRLENSKSITAS